MPPCRFQTVRLSTALSFFLVLIEIIEILRSRNFKSVKTLPPNHTKSYKPVFSCLAVVNVPPWTGLVSTHPATILAHGSERVERIRELPTLGL
jgi:hypothetical protein